MGGNAAKRQGEFVRVSPEDRRADHVIDVPSSRLGAERRNRVARRFDGDARGAFYGSLCRARHHHCALDVAGDSARRAPATERRRRSRPAARRAHRHRLVRDRRGAADARLCHEELRGLLSARVVPLVPRDPAIPGRGIARGSAMASCAALIVALCAQRRNRRNDENGARALAHPAHTPGAGLEIALRFHRREHRRRADRRCDCRGDSQVRRRRDSCRRLGQQLRQHAAHRRGVHRPRDARTRRPSGAIAT